VDISDNQIVLKEETCKCTEILALVINDIHLLVDITHYFL